MDKLLDKLLIEFLVPAVLMLLCITLLIDIISGDNFNLYSDYKTINEYIWGVGLIVSYILNTSLSAAFNIFFRPIIWGKTREYIIYRKLNLFDEEELRREKLYWIKYIWKSKSKNFKNDIESKIEKTKDTGDNNLYNDLIERLRYKSIPIRATKSPYDIYDAIRTVVLTSGDNAVISWIQYHWSQLRLSRSCLVPTFSLIFLAPFALYTWGASCIYIASMCVFSLLLFTSQFVHYYYRERFMIYSMLSYLFAMPIKETNEKPQTTGRPLFEKNLSSFQKWVISRRSNDKLN